MTCVGRAGIFLKCLLSWERSPELAKIRNYYPDLAQEAAYALEVLRYLQNRRIGLVKVRPKRKCHGLAETAAQWLLAQARCCLLQLGLGPEWGLLAILIIGYPLQY